MGGRTPLENGTAKRAARDLGVRGWVRNRPDGTVEAVFEGASQAVDQALQWCWQGSPMANVSDVKIERETFTGEFEGFAITH